MKYTQNEIENAKKILRDSGFVVEGLWSLPDITERYTTEDGNEVDEVIAYDISQEAVTNDYIVQTIWNGIDQEAYNHHQLIEKN